MLWVHIHKAAGTTMCALAKINGERVVKPNRNCNWDFDGSIDILTTSTPSCKGRADHFNKNGYTWGQIERELYDGAICPDFDYGIMLRDPIKLRQSFAFYQLKPEE